MLGVLQKPWPTRQARQMLTLLGKAPPSPARPALPTTARAPGSRTSWRTENEQKQRSSSTWNSLARNRRIEDYRWPLGPLNVGCSKAKAHKALRRVASPPVAGLSKTCSCGEPPRPGCRRARQVPQVLNAGQLPDRCIRKSSGRSSRPRSTPRTMREHELLKESPGRARDEAILELHSLRSAARQPPPPPNFFSIPLQNGPCPWPLRHHGIA